MATNDITGDTIATHPYSDKYGEGHDRIWRKKPEKLAEAVRHFQRDIQPLIDQKAKFFMYKMPKAVINADGSLQPREYEFSEEETRAMALIDEAIAQVAKGYGLPWPN